MACDGVANIVNRLRERGFDPRRVGSDAWESRCPVHRGSDYALAITRGDRARVLLDCRSRRCRAASIESALDFTANRLYAGTPNWVLQDLSKRPIVPSLYPGTNREERALPSAARAEDRGPTAVPVAVVAAAIAGLNAPERTPTGADDQGPSPPNPGVLPVPSPMGRVNQGPRTTYEGPPGILPDRSRTGRGGDQSVVDGLLDAAAPARLFRLADGRLLAQLQSGGRQEFYGLKSAEFRDWLLDRYLAAGGKVPSKWSIRRAVDAIDARARCDGTTPELSVRVGRKAADESLPIYVDVGDSDCRAIAIDACGWALVDRPRVAFRRPEGFLSLPVPSRDGSIELLRSYVNLSDRDFRLLIVWLAAALRPVGPYPILALYGEQGSAKSTLARIVRRLVDPHAAPLLVEPKSTRDLMITALNGWLLAYDNISTIPRWLSDALCTIATGGAYAGRTEYTTLECTVLHAQRPIVLTGIDEFIRRGDLSDRSVVLHLPPIPPSTRRREDELWQALNRDHPRILGGLLDAIVGGLREQPNVKLAELPRMADFAAAGEAIGRGLGWPFGTMLADYEASRREAAAAQIEDSLVATVLLQHAGRLGSWTGTPAELHADLTAAAGRKAAASARWPKSPDRLANELRRIAPQLRMHGLNLTFGRTYKGRFVALEPSGTTPPKTSDMCNGSY